jgi:hypothetical protein
MNSTYLRYFRRFVKQDLAPRCASRKPRSVAQECIDPVTRPSDGNPPGSTLLWRKPGSRRWPAVVLGAVLQIILSFDEPSMRRRCALCTRLSSFAAVPIATGSTPSCASSPLWLLVRGLWLGHASSPLTESRCACSRSESVISRGAAAWFGLHAWLLLHGESTACVWVRRCKHAVLYGCY